jgi:soluble lytic murein transglycosylase
MLETLSQRRFTLPPYQVPEFDLPKLQQRFPPEGRQQLQRIDQLLAQGLRSEAACEIRELAVATDDEDQQLVKVLYLYASGEWLQAIKSYNRLSRPFRHSLPRGMERLLFPRRYVDLVRKYAQRLKVPEEFVYSIIRQESVFNPRALSVVGASGLMQLMPATARLEARRLSRGYVSGRSRRQLIRHSRRQSHLFDAETNITLGTHHVFHLFQRYKNPIFVLTAYNANPRATEKWQKNLDTSDMLAFVERIPYRETRAYVKLVMRNYFYYNRWYRSVDQEMPFMEYLAPKMVALARRQPLKDIPWSTQ